MSKEIFNLENAPDLHYDKDIEVPAVYEERQRKQRRLRLVKSRLENRETFFKLEQDILKKIKKAGSDPEKIARLEKRLEEDKKDIADLNDYENKLETEIAEKFGDYLGPESELLDGLSPSERDS